MPATHTSSDDSDDPQTQPPHSSQTPGSQPIDSQSQPNWILKNASMRILDFSVKVPGRPMNIRMEFTLKNGTKKIVDMEHTTENLKNSRKIVINKCEQYLYLDGVKSEKQDKLFGCFIDQYLKLFDEQVNPSTNTAKPVLEILKPSVELIGERRYWISGQHDIFLLNSGNSFAYKMTQEEIVNLPVEVIFVGRDNPNYIVDEKRAFEIIVQIIGKTNQLQPPGNKLSFPLASFCANMAAFLYTILVVRYRYFPTALTLSGSGSTPRTGKSLMTSCWQLAFFGYWPKQAIKISEASLFEHVNKGETFYLREWNKHADILNVIIPMVWERLGKDTKAGFKTVNAAVLIEANLSPKDIKFETANDSKVIFIATGSSPLKHRNMMKLCQEIEDLGRELHAHMPVLCGLGLNTMLDKITDPQLESYDGILKKDGDDREGQFFCNYDRLHAALEHAIEEYDLEKPLLFQQVTIDREAITFFNDREDKMTPEKMAEVVGQYILDEELDDCIEYSEKSKKFKLKLPAAGLPENIFKAMKGVTKETTTTFDGVKLKVRMLPASLLPERLLAELKALGQTYNFSDWIAKMLDEKQTRREETGEAFYKKVTRKHSNRKPQPEISVIAEVDDEIVDEPTPGPSVTNIPASQPTETEEALRCMLSGCPSYTHLFSTNKTYEKHLRSKGHTDVAEKMKGKGKGKGKGRGRKPK